MTISSPSKRSAAARAPRPSGYALIVASLLALFLVAFAAVEALDVTLLSDPDAWLDEPGVAAAAVGVGLLVADVVLPVPSSAVMIAHGALFGVVGGTLLSLAGGLAATLAGFLVGRRSRPLVDRIVPAERRARAERRLTRYGPLAIIVTRPVPMLAETTAIIAGTSAMRWRSAAIAGALGTLVPALLYAIAGALAASLANQALVFAAAIAAAALFWAGTCAVGETSTAPSTRAAGADATRATTP